EEAPTPRVKRPGAVAANVAAVCASTAGPLLKADAMAIPRWAVVVLAAAMASGVKPSVAIASAVHRSVYPRDSRGPCTRGIRVRGRHRPDHSAARRRAGS